MTESRFRIKQIAPQRSDTWAVTEWFCWNPAANEVLKRDTDGALFEAAYDAVDWESYYERLKGTPFYKWAVEGGGILSFGGPFHIERCEFFSTIGDMSTFEGDWLRKHPEFNQVLHDIHVEMAEQMIDYLLNRDQRNAGRHKLWPGVRKG
jgi:hypothetical protein